MKRRLRVPGAIAAIVLGAAIPPAVRAQLSSTVAPCQESIAKAGLKFAARKLKTIQKCNENNMKSPGACVQADLDAAVATLVTKLNDGLAKRCGPPFPSLGLSLPPPRGIGFPGDCPQGGFENFTLADLEGCMAGCHEDAVDALIALEWGTTTANADGGVVKCQKAIDKAGGKVLQAVLKAVQGCRNRINKGGSGLAINCATADPKASAVISKAESKATAAIIGRCTDAQVQALDVCTPKAASAADAAACIVSTHHLAADDPSPTSDDLIDCEYPQANGAVCGDDVKNQPSEECDGSDAAACPGNCGAANGPFPCLCLNVPRERVVEHADSDIDNGWRGDSHDTGVVEGGGYVVNLYDCDSDNTCGIDTCTIGASCINAPHSACTNDAQCFFEGGTCRTDRTDVGPHCALHIQTVCSSNADCPANGDFCLKTFHGPPLPLSSGGVSVCVLNVFSENVVGTRNVGLGSEAIRLRQKAITHLTGTSSQPCPICGGFCEAPVNSSDRHICSTNADCADVTPVQHCVTEAFCSSGPNADKACRPDPPFGGTTTLFGTTSIDCPPNPTTDISNGGLDILFNPATTGVVHLLPSYQCDDGAFTGKTCAGGSNNGAPCTAASECPGGTVCTDPALCPGGVGTSPCSFQCYCPNGGAIHQRPNGCDGACVGGAGKLCRSGSNDGASCMDVSECPGGACAIIDGFPCTDNATCPGGFCHLADCRPDPLAAPLLQPNEGACTATVEGHCSISMSKTCNANPDCQPPACLTCQSGETCDIVGKNCFINSGTTSSGLTRAGVADATNPVSAALFCIQPTGLGSVDGAAGLPGPGARIQPETTVETGLIHCP